ADHGEQMVAPRIRQLWAGFEEGPGIDRAPAGWKVEGRGHHPDHLVRHAIEPDRVADQGWIASEPAPPELLANHDHLGLAGLVRTGVESSTEEGRGSQEREEVWGGLHRLDTLRGAGGLEV